MSDARFEDAAFTDRPIRLAAQTDEDLQVISALLQDAVGSAADVSWMPKRRRLAILLNRFRWEDVEDAKRAGRTAERVRSALLIDSALAVRALGLDPSDKDQIFAILQATFEAGEDGAGRINLTLAGDGEISADVECLDLSLIDLTKPWTAQSGLTPDHKLEDTPSDVGGNDA
jgi:hypothetical protein